MITPLFLGGVMLPGPQLFNQTDVGGSVANVLGVQLDAARLVVLIMPGEPSKVLVSQPVQFPAEAQQKSACKHQPHAPVT